MVTLSHTITSAISQFLCVSMSSEQFAEDLVSAQAPPTYLLVENVIGFERSRTRDAMQDLMQSAGYILQARLVC